MAGWTEQQLATIADTDEVEVTSRRDSGSLRTWRTIWGVRVGEDVFVRAAYGPGTGWYRWAERSGEGRFRAGDIEVDVRFVAAPPELEDAVDAAYTAKYQARYPSITPGIVGEKVHGLTLRVDGVA